MISWISVNRNGMVVMAGGYFLKVQHLRLAGRGTINLHVCVTDFIVQNFLKLTGDFGVNLADGRQRQVKSADEQAAFDFRVEPENEDWRMLRSAGHDDCHLAGFQGLLQAVQKMDFS